MMAIAETAAAAVKNLRALAFAAIRLRPATRMPTTQPTRAVLVYVRMRMAAAGTAAIVAARPPIRPQNQSMTTNPSTTAA